MVEKVILNIAHSDSYTDSLIMTAGLTNRRIILIISPTREKLKKKDEATLFLRCSNSRTVFSPGWDEPVTANTETESIRINSCFYLDDDGNINTANAEIVRLTMEKITIHALFTEENLRELFRHYFPLLWSKHQLIYDNPRVFFADTGRLGRDLSFEGEPIGAVLKAMDEKPKTSRIRLGGGCSCGADPMLIDYDRVYEQHRTLYTWCPACQARGGIRAWIFPRAERCNQAIEEATNYYNKGQGISPLSLLDIIDAIKEN